MFGHLTYLVFETVWALPVLLIQWAAGASILAKRWRTLLIGTLVPTLYLSAADAAAIANGIWALHGNRIVGLRLGNLPLEESLFFLLTNAMVVQSLLLVLGIRARRASRFP